MCKFRGSASYSVTGEGAFEIEGLIDKVQKAIQEVFEANGLIGHGFFGGALVNEAFSLEEIMSEADAYRFFVCPVHPDETDEEGCGYEVDLVSYIKEVSTQTSFCWIVEFIDGLTWGNHKDYVEREYNQENPIEDAMDECKGELLVLGGYGEYPRSDRYGIPSWAADGAGFLADVAGVFDEIIACGDMEEIFLANDSGDDTSQRQHILVARKK